MLMAEISSILLEGLRQRVIRYFSAIYLILKEKLQIYDDLFYYL